MYYKWLNVDVPIFIYVLELIKENEINYIV